MQQVKLILGEWSYDPTDRLGPPGGFGSVFRGKAPDGTAVAVKKLVIKPDEAQHRELDVAAELAGIAFEHALPILDSGHDSESDSYFVVMPLAEKSLRSELNDGRSFSDTEVASVTLAVARGLEELHARIVHRDVKPDNILGHEGRWRVADFGIAMFVEKSTSARTLKLYKSKKYAAPEQWKEERCSPSTDVYALGCVTYELLMGFPPFAASAGADLKEQHLHKSIDVIEGHDGRLATLIALMLKKPPEMRPSIARIIRILTPIAEDGGSPEPKVLEVYGALAHASAAAAASELAEEARIQEEHDEALRRDRVATVALEELESIVEYLLSKLESYAHAATRRVFGEGPGSDVHWALDLGAASLLVDVFTGRTAVQKGRFSRSKWDVISGARIAVHQSEPNYVWGASLWYSNLGEGESYRWFEVSYWSMKRGLPQHEPFATDNADVADMAAHGGTPYQIAYGPIPVDGENLEGFCGRWAELLTKASEGKLRAPSRYPLESVPGS